jgi:hypothetical protein
VRANERSARPLGPIYPIPAAVCYPGRVSAHHRRNIDLDQIGSGLGPHGCTARSFVNDCEFADDPTLTNALVDQAALTNDLN